MGDTSDIEQPTFAYANRILGVEQSYGGNLNFGDLTEEQRNELQINAKGIAPDILQAAHFDLVGTGSVNKDDMTVNADFLQKQGAEINELFKKLDALDININEIVNSIPNKLIQEDLTVLVGAYQVAKNQNNQPQNAIQLSGVPAQANQGVIPTAVAVKLGGLNIVQQAVQNRAVRYAAYHQNANNKNIQPQNNNQVQPNPYLVMANNLNQQVQAFHNVNTTTYGSSYTNLITNLESSGTLKYLLDPEELEALMPMLEQMTPGDKATFMEVLNQINTLTMFTVGKSKEYLQEQYAILQKEIGEVSNEEARSYLTKELTKLERAIEKAKTTNTNVIPFPKNQAPHITQLKAA